MSGRLKRPELPLCGGCTCEAVRYEISAMPLMVFACHCTECQRWTGSAFGLSMPVIAKHFRLIRGEPKTYRRVGNSGVESSYWFCRDCGGRAYGQRANRPDIITVRAGTLDDTSWVRPGAHICLESAQAWERVPNHIACFELLPSDFAPLAQTWQQLWSSE